MSDIQCILENERGESIKAFKDNFVPILNLAWKIDTPESIFPWIITINYYGDTTFNPLQCDYLITNLQYLKNHADSQNSKIIDNLILFIQEIDTHTYIKFIGD